MIQSLWDWKTVFGATAKTATGTGALPSNVPIGGRAPAPAKGSLGWTNGALVGTLRGDVPAGAFPFWPAEFLPARRGQESAGRRTAQRTIPTTARRRKRPPGRARSPAMSQPGGQWQFRVDERGKGRLKSFRAKGAKAAKSRSDAMTIAQPFMAG